MEIGLRGKEEKKLSKLSELKYTVAIVKLRFFSIFKLKIMKKVRFDEILHFLDKHPGKRSGL